MDEIHFKLRGEFITLDALLKATGLVGSGGAAKQLITNGEVRVDGQVDTRRGAKIRAGQRVQVAGQRIRLLAPELPPTT
jgi:ribosome-associated protein